MQRKYKIIITGVGVAVILAVAIATTAFAASKAAVRVPATAQAAKAGITSGAIPTEADYQAWGCPVANGNFEAVAKLLGMTPQEIEAQLEQGKSLVEIASAKGVTEDALVAAIFTPMKEFMQQQVTAGNWTQQQLDAHLKLAEQHVRQLVNAKGVSGNAGCGGAGMMGGTGGMMGNYGGMMGGGWNRGSANQGGFFGRGGMMGGGYGGMMGGFQY